MAATDLQPPIEHPQRSLDRTRFHHDVRFTQRITAKEWRDILLAEEDTIITKGMVRQFVAKNLGYGVVEVYLLPKEKRNETD
jgi:hypothetical protein